MDRASGTRSEVEFEPGGVGGMGVGAVLVERAELAGKAAMADALSLAFPRRLSRDARPMGTPEQRALMERIEETV